MVGVPNAVFTPVLRAALYIECIDCPQKALVWDREVVLGNLLLLSTWHVDDLTYIMYV